VTDHSPRLIRVLREELDQRQRSALASWFAFTGTFATVRGITYSIKAGRGPFRNLSVGGEHLHHYLWGIGMLAGVGAVAVRGSDRLRAHPIVAISYGSGLALIVDEFALLLDLKDVYWAKQGRISVDLGIGGIAAVGSYFAANPGAAGVAPGADRPLTRVRVFSLWPVARPPASVNLDRGGRDQHGRAGPWCLRAARWDEPITGEERHDQ
jgi:hypothetical protein